ncbi:RHS repeat-associated core domain-containing protein [Streptomyces sp. NBC_00209]
MGGQELNYDTVTKKFTAQRYYPAGDATAVRTESGLSWMVDDHHGTASMTVDATTQAVTRRYTKPFGESRGATPSAWPDDKGFLGKPSDVDTGLTHVGAREYDPASGRFLSVDPVLAPEDHESLNGYAYANNTPVTLSDPTGLRPDGACGGASSSCNGGTETWTKTKDGWDWSYTKTTTKTFSYKTDNGTVGQGTMSTTVHQTAGTTTTKITFKKGPEPKPKHSDGTCHSCWAMGTNPHYDYNAHDLPDHGKLATWQKVLLGVVTTVATAVVAAPVVVAIGEGCLVTAPVCVAEIAETMTGGASGGSAVVGSGLAGTGVAAATSRGAEGVAVGLRREEYVAKLIGGTLAKDAKGEDIRIVMPNVGRTGLDVRGPNGEMVFVGGGAKAKNPAAFGKALKISKYAADEEGVPAIYYLASNTPESAIKQAQKWFGPENVHTFTMPE